MIRILIIVVMLAYGTSAGAQVKIGLALPLMIDSTGAPSFATGQQMLKGIHKALDEYKRFDEITEIELVTKDTRREPQRAVEILNEFGADASFSAVLGPVFSSELAASAGAGAFHKIPVISPAATQNGIAAKNEFVFQLNPTYEVRGRVMADYASKKMDLHRFLVLSEETYGKSYVEGFVSRARQNGDTVLYAEYFSREETDLTEKVSALKRYLIEYDRFIDFAKAGSDKIAKLQSLGLKKERLDTLAGKRYLMSIYELFGKNADSAVRSAGIVTDRHNEAAPYVRFGIADALYIPVSRSEDIDKLVLALFRSGIEIPLLGTSDWNNLQALDYNSKFLTGLTFEADFFLTAEERKNLGFESEQDARSFLLGYAAMKALLDAISADKFTRTEINGYLEQLSHLELPFNSIRMNNRTNSSLNILEYSNGKLIKIGNYSE